MDVSGLGYAAVRNPTQTASTDTEKQIEELEKKKEKLEEDLKKKDNPFAAKQSTECESIKKKIQQLDEQIKKLKAESSKKSENTSAAKDAKESRADDNREAGFSSAHKFDEFIRSEDLPKQSSSGIYSISTDENGKAKIYFDQPESSSVNTESTDEIQMLERLSAI